MIQLVFVVNAGQLMFWSIEDVSYFTEHHWSLTCLFQDVWCGRSEVGEKEVDPLFWRGYCHYLHCGHEWIWPDTGWGSRDGWLCTLFTLSLRHLNVIEVIISTAHYHGVLVDSDLLSIPQDWFVACLMVASCQSSCRNGKPTHPCWGRWPLKTENICLQTEAHWIVLHVRLPVNE